MTTRRPPRTQTPLDTWISPTPHARRQAAPPVAPPRPDRKVRATFHVPASVVEEARAAVIALAGPPVRLTLARLVEEALREKLASLKQAYHRGKPWPKATAPLVGGRPIKAERAER